MSNVLLSASVVSFQALCGTIKIFQKERIYRLWFGFRPVVIFFMPETVEVLLSSNTILNKTFMYDFLRPWFKDGLITSSGSKWRTRRKLLTPAFHFRILEDFLPVIDEHSQALIDALNDKHEPIDIVHPVTLCTLDILCETAMGKKVGAIQNSESPYVHALRLASEQFAARVMKPWLWPDQLYYLTPSGRRYRNYMATMGNFTREVIKERKEYLKSQMEAEGSSMHHCEETGQNRKRRRQAFLDLLLYHHIRDDSLSEEDIREEVDTFMFAGHDTTAMGISWALYNIGLYPEVQRKIQEELYEIFGDDVQQPVTAECLKEMKYLECCIKESQRLFPSLPVIGRELHEDAVVNGYTIPSGTTCLLVPYMLHRNPEVFPNPEVFDPERFLTTNCAGRHPYAYIPFSAGPRNCIGQRFAMMEQKIVVGNILRHYNLRSVDPPDRLHLRAEMVLRSENGLSIQLSRRST